MRQLFFLFFLLPFSLSADILSIKGLEISPPKKHYLNLSLAQTSQEKAWGWMNKQQADENEALLFTYHADTPLTFWMFGCYIDIDLAFLDKKMRVQEIHTMKAYPDQMDKSRPIQTMQDLSLYPPDDPIRSFFMAKQVQSKQPYRYALELPGGYFSQKKLSPGCKLFFTKSNHPYLQDPLDLALLPKDQALWVSLEDSPGLVLTNSSHRAAFTIFELSASQQVIDTYPLLPNLTQASYSLKRKEHALFLLILPKRHPMVEKITKGRQVSLLPLFS